MSEEANDHIEEAVKISEARMKKARIPNPWPCVSCGKPIRRDENIGFENDAVVMTSRAGFGSCHDMGLVKVVICDDCVCAKAIVFPLEPTE